MDKKDIFEELNMSEYIWGNAYLYSISDIDLSIEKNQISKLDEICKIEGWNELGEKWNSIEFLKCSELLLDSIEFDIAYSSSRITPTEIAKKFHAELLNKFNNDSFCYSNWFNNQWRSNKNGSSWNPLTENTFDISTVFINKENILITCFRSED
ncbi:hypothetical protein GCM10009430_48560 [Aquimarina litoralis]|uniref:Uncharacterized protein n=2 Tax=Aquimarina litoralis TaxID=584605 RepID=A0ABN1JAJ5_9FLAO